MKLRLRSAALAPALAAPVALAFGLASAQDKGDKGEGLAALAGKVHEKVFPNGLRLLVLEKHTAPSVAMATCVDVGSSDENTGETGIAHLFEHMAFKGSTTVGTSDSQKEKGAIEKVESSFLRLKQLRTQLRVTAAHDDRLGGPFLDLNAVAKGLLAKAKLEKAEQEALDKAEAAWKDARAKDDPAVPAAKYADFDAARSKLLAKAALSPDEKASLENAQKGWAKVSKAALASPTFWAWTLWKDLQDEAGKFVVTDEFSTILSRAGGAGLNAFTSADVTCYTVTLPANRLELWFYMEADRFRDPVLREFYKEREDVKEERRMRVESNPTGELFESFISTAYHAHPYGRPVIGWMCDLEALSATTAKQFFARHYAPNHMTITLAGDVDFDKAVALAEKYFGDMPRAPELDPLPTVEPDPNGERRVTLEKNATPIVILGYHIPPAKDDDTPALDALSDVLGTGRTSRLHKQLVVEKKLATNAGAGIGDPGQKYGNLFLFEAVPTSDHSTDECVKAIDEEIAKVRADLVSQEELEIVKTRARASFYRQLVAADWKETVSVELGRWQTVRGSWRAYFDYPSKIAALTPEDLRRVARKYLVKAHRTRGDIVPPEKKDDAKNDGQKKDGE